MAGAKRNRKFDGKTFYFDTMYRQKYEANHRKKVIQNRDKQRARVVKSETKAGTRYYVYRGPHRKTRS